MTRFVALINAGNIRSGGGLQVASSFLSICLERRTDLFYVISPELFVKFRDVLPFGSYTVSDERAGSIFGKYQRSKIIKAITTRLEIEIVFSIFGPEIIVGPVRHYQGFALPWVIYDTSSSRASLGTLRYLLVKFTAWVQRVLFKFNTSAIICETTDAAQRASKLLKVRAEVVSNNAAQNFHDHQFSKKSFDESAGLQLFYPSFPHPHKNHQFLFNALQHIESQVVVFVTLPPESPLLANAPPQVVNLGILDQQGLLSAYEICDAVVSVSSLECFSALIPEAFTAGKPLLLPRLPFFEDVAGKGAIYFEPNSVSDFGFAIEKLNHLLAKESEPDLSNILNKQKQLLEDFDSPEVRYQKYLRIIQSAR